MSDVQDLSAHMLREELFDDIKIEVKPTIWNTLQVTYDMSKTTHAILGAYCLNKGLDLDDLLSDAIQHTLNEATKRREQIELRDNALRAFVRLQAFLVEQEGITVQMDVVGNKDRIRLSGQPSQTFMRELRDECTRRGYKLDVIWKGIMAQMADNESLRLSAAR